MDKTLKRRRPLIPLFLFGCCVLFDPGLVAAQNNPPILDILVRENDGGSSSTLPDVAGTAVVFVRHFAAYGVGGSSAKFRIGASSGFTGVLVSVEYAPGTVVWEGNITDGVLIYYEPLCDYFVNFPIVELTYQLMGTSEPCSYITVLPHPDEATVLVGTCTLGMVAPRVDPLGVNWNWTQCEFPVATEQTTWGRLKALYRD